MPVELRKRKATEPAAAPPAKKASTVKSAASKAKAAITGKKAAKTNGETTKDKVAAGGTITLEGFGGEVETNDGEKTTLKKLVDESKNGVVIFTYPKASTSSCTTQACLFRDQFDSLTSTGFAIYGLSLDSPKSNTTFKTKQKLPYTLLCDPSATLISTIGMKKAPKSTTRGVFVVDKEGKVLVAEPGGPAATVEAVKKLVGVNGTAEAAAPVADEPAELEGEAGDEKDSAVADVAADVADTAEKLDGAAA